MEKAVIKIPFKKGNLVDYMYNGQTNNYSWKDKDYTITRTMKIVSTRRGRSSAQFILEDEEGHVFNMFMTDTLDMLQRAHIVNGKVQGVWGFKKRGTNYGMKYIGEKL